MTLIVMINFKLLFLIYRHGQAWQDFRSKVQQVLLQPKIAKLYMKPIEETADAFIER